MTLEERKGLTNNIIQNLVLENRGKLSVSGVLDVLSFDMGYSEKEMDKKTGSLLGKIFK